MTTKLFAEGIIASLQKPRQQKNGRQLQLLQPFRAMMDSGSLYYPIGLILVALLFLGFGVAELGKFITTDETVWLHVRIPQYWQALISGDFAKTEISLNPGITHSLLAGLTEFFIHLENYTPLTIEHYLFWWRIPGLVFNFLSLFIIYYFIRELTDKDHALLITGLIAFTPVILGMSRIPNSDSQLWNTGFIAILTFLLYLKTNSYRYIVFCGIAFGLCLLCKFAATSLYLFFFTYLYAGYLFRQYDREAFLRKSIGFLQILLLSWALYAILYPATLIRPQMIFGTTIGHFGNKIWYILSFMLLIYIENILFKGRFSGWLLNRMDFEKAVNIAIGLPFLALAALLSYYRFFSDAPFSLLTIYRPIAYGEFLPTFIQGIDKILREISIPVIGSMIVFAAISPFSFSRQKFRKDYHLITLMMLSIALFIIGSAFKGVVPAGRYAILVLPAYAFIAGCVFLKFFRNNKVAIPIFLVLAFVDIVMFAPLSYLDYSNDKYFKERGRYYSWGMGGYELARMANQLPDAKNLTILSDYHGFGHFFVGKNSYVMERVTSDHIRQFDYLCLSSSGKSQKERWRMMTYPLMEYYNKPIEESEYHVGSTERGYFRLVKVDKDKKYLSIPGAFDPEYFIDLSRPFSIAFWFRTHAVNPGNPIYIGKDHRHGILLQFTAADDALLFETKYDEMNRLKTSVFNNNQWHHILLRHYGGNIQDKVDLFINGEKRDTIFLTQSKIGFEKFFINTKFNGQMQDFRIYDFALSQSQINSVFNNGEIRTESKLYDGEKPFQPVGHFTVK